MDFPAGRNKQFIAKLCVCTVDKLNNCQIKLIIFWCSDRIRRNPCVVLVSHTIDVTRVLGYLAVMALRMLPWQSIVLENGQTQREMSQAMSAWHSVAEQYNHRSNKVQSSLQTDSTDVLLLQRTTRGQLRYYKHFCQVIVLSIIIQTVIYNHSLFQCV